MSQGLDKEVHLYLQNNVPNLKSWSSHSPLKSCPLFLDCIDCHNILIWLLYLNGSVLIKAYIIIVHYGRVIINSCTLYSVLCS